MATVTYIKESKQSPSAMRGLIKYCVQDFKVQDENGQRFVSGVNCDGDNAFGEFMATKLSYGKTDGINFYQYVQSFSPSEDIDAETSHKIAIEFAEKAWLGHEVLVTTHIDANHIHSHFVINSVSFEDGHKLRQHPDSLIKLRALSDEICQAHGLTTLNTYTGGGTKVGSREYRSASKGESWKFKLMFCIDRAMDRSGSCEDFIKNMRRYGYEILWTDERKYITFTCPNGKRCRDKTLHDEKYLKENIEYELRFREKQYKQNAQTADREERFGNRGNESGANADARTDSRKGLGYDGGATSSGGGFSAESLRADGNAADGEGYRGASPCAGRDNPWVLQQPFEAAEGADEREARRERKDTQANEGERRSGWEESRANYERFRGSWKGARGSNTRGERGERHTNVAHKNGMHGNSLGSFGSVWSPAMHAMAGVNDNNEDPEERKRRMESEIAASNLGTVVGAAVGIAMCIADKNTDDELKNEIDEMSQSM